MMERGMTMLLAGAVTSAATLLALPLHAQNVLLDEGTFAVFLDDREAGTETFSIRRMGAGVDTRILANAMVELDRRQMRPLLESNPQAGLTRYEVKVSGDEVAEVSVVSAGNRFVALIRTTAGEQEREFRARPGAVLLEENVAHQYWFAVSQLAVVGDAVPVVDPRGTEQPRLELLAVGEEAVRIAGQTIDARRLRMSLSGVERTVWVDREGRVLRVEVPSTGYRAERTAPPA